MLFEISHFAGQMLSPYCKQLSEDLNLGSEFRIFSEDPAAVTMKKTKLYLNQPIYVGFTILDLSKVLMYQFHYEYMKQKYDANAKLLFTDTDSLSYEVKTRDIYQDMLEDAELFDTSEYAQDHLLYSIKTRKFSR